MILRSINVGDKISLLNILLVLIGIVIFFSSFVSGGLLFNWGSYTYFAWFIGLILVAIGFWRNDKEKKAKS